MFLEIAVLIVLIGAVVLVVGPRFRRAPQDGARGTLLVTGVSPKPDETGQQFVTISGVINGPTVDEHVVYQRIAVDVTEWPSMGQLYPVIYSPNNPDNWTFAPPA